MVRWGPACPIRPSNFRSSEGHNPDIDCRRARSCSRNRSWADCTMSTRSWKQGPAPDRQSPRRMFRAAASTKSVLAGHSCDGQIPTAGTTKRGIAIIRRLQKILPPRLLGKNRDLECFARLPQLLVQRSEWKAVALRKFEVRGVVGRKSESPCNQQNAHHLGRRVYFNRQCQ